MSLAESVEIPIELEVENDASNSLHIPEDVDNPLDNFRLGATETMLVSNLPPIEDLVIAPGEDVQPMSILMDEKCEELAHPHLFPTGKFGYKVQREIKLSPVKYFNQRLLNYKQTFSSDSDYIFYALSVMQQLNLSSQINVAMKKVCTNHRNKIRLHELELPFFKYSHIMKNLSHCFDSRGHNVIPRASCLF